MTLKGPITRSDVAVLSLSAIVIVVGFLTAVVLPERHTATTGQLALAKADIQTIEQALNRYDQQVGHYPAQLDELLKTSERTGFLKKIPRSPWDTPYVLAATPSTPDHPYTVSTTPDPPTQQRIHASTLSSDTDWSALIR